MAGAGMGSFGWVYRFTIVSERATQGGNPCKAVPSRRAIPGNGGWGVASNSQRGYTPSRSMQRIP